MFRGIINRFNRGEVSDRASVRTDVNKVHNAASWMENWLPVKTGSMVYRPGTRYLGKVPKNGRLLEFIKSTTDTALLVFGDSSLRGVVEDDYITRNTVTTTITNGEFATDISGWVNGSGAGSTAIHSTYYGGSALLYGVGSTRAELSQTITSVDSGEHGVRITVHEAPATVTIADSGTTFFDGELEPGVHSLAFTPTSGSLVLTIANPHEIFTYVSTISFETSSVDWELPTPIIQAHLPYLKTTQSGDVVFCAKEDIAQFKIKRRGTKSWSVVDSRFNDGPFETINTSEIALAVSALSGSVSLTSSDDLFTSDHVGVLYKMVSDSQTVDADVAAEDNGTTNIFVSGASTVRTFTISITGTFTATVTLQRSIDEATWTDIKTYTTAASESYSDGLDNAEMHYRLYVKPGEYTSGIASLSLIYTSGSIEGVVRTTKYITSTHMYAQVLIPLGSTDATRDWYEGSWSIPNGYPTAVGLYEGRMWYAGSNKVWGSVSDGYDSFDRSIEGASASIQKTIGLGPADDVHWLAGGDKLIMGLASNEISIRSNSFADPLSASNCNLKGGSEIGSSYPSPAPIDGGLFFVDRSGLEVHHLSYNFTNDKNVVTDVTALFEGLGLESTQSITKLAITRHPETRLLAVTSEGNLKVLLFDAAENVVGWSTIKTGSIKDVVVIPGTDEDRVYFLVDRGDAADWYLEKLELFSQSQGGALSFHFDSAVYYLAPGTTTLTGLDHLEGLTVGVWGSGQDRGTFVVSSGSITVPSVWVSVTVGLPYTAYYKSNRLEAYEGPGVNVLSMKKRIADVSVILRNYWPGALKVGPTNTTVSDLPELEDGTSVDQTAVLVNYDEPPFEFDGDDETDPRICMNATGPCEVLAVTYGVTNVGSDNSSVG